MIFDAHSDILAHISELRIAEEKDNCFRNYHLDSFKKGNISSGIFVIWENTLSDNFEKISAEQIVKCLKDELNESTDIFNLIKSGKDFDENKINMIVGIEGLAHIKTDLDMLDYYYNEVFTRHSSLTWNESNELATGIRGDNDRGVTSYGKQAIKKMESLGMIVDVSHLNEKSFWDVIDVCSKPIIASHSNCKALCDVVRNLTDEQIKAVASTGGIICINSYRGFVAKEENCQTVLRLAEHASHIAELVGVSHIGFGFDFLEYLEKDKNSHQSGAEGINSPYETHNLLNALKQVGFSDLEIRKISEENMKRVFENL